MPGNLAQLDFQINSMLLAQISRSEPEDGFGVDPE